MAAKRITKEFRELEKDPPHSCSAGPVSSEVWRGVFATRKTDSDTDTKRERET